MRRKNTISMQGTHAAIFNEKDKKIIAVLKEDGRATIKEIAATTKLRPSTVHQRMQQLQKGSVIEYFTVKTNDHAMQEEFIIFLLIKGSTQQYLTQSFLADPRVKEVFGVTGEYDVLVKMKFSNVFEFNKCIIALRKENKNITATLTMVGTATIKEMI